MDHHAWIILSRVILHPSSTRQPIQPNTGDAWFYLDESTRRGARSTMFEAPSLADMTRRPPHDAGSQGVDDNDDEASSYHCSCKVPHDDNNNDDDEASTPPHDGGC